MSKATRATMRACRAAAVERAKHPPAPAPAPPLVAPRRPLRRVPPRLAATLALAAIVGGDRGGWGR